MRAARGNSGPIDMSEQDRQPPLEYSNAAHPVAAPLEDQQALLQSHLLTGRTWRGLIALALLFGVVNLSSYALMESPLVFCYFGIIAAQPFVLSAWLAWGGGSFLKRFALHWEVAYALAITLLIGAILTEEEGFGNRSIREDFKNFLLSLPLLGLWVQLPFWAARVGFGWRLVDEYGDNEPHQPLAIRDVMAGTVIVGVSLAAAKLAEGMERSTEGWIEWAILASIMAGISLIFVLPVAAWLLRRRRVPLGLLLTAIYAALAVAVTWTVFCVAFRNLWFGAWWTMITLGVTIFSFAATLAAAALATRAAGFRLGTGRRASDHQRNGTT
jgi:hypothetical protein